MPIERGIHIHTGLMNALICWCFTKALSLHIQRLTDLEKAFGVCVVLITMHMQEYTNCKQQSTHAIPGICMYSCRIFFWFRYVWCTTYRYNTILVRLFALLQVPSYQRWFRMRDQQGNISWSCVCVLLHQLTVNQRMRRSVLCHWTVSYKTAHCSWISRRYHVFVKPTWYQVKMVTLVFAQRATSTIQTQGGVCPARLVNTRTIRRAVPLAGDVTSFEPRFNKQVPPRTIVCVSKGAHSLLFYVEQSVRDTMPTKSGIWNLFCTCKLYCKVEYVDEGF